MTEDICDYFLDISLLTNRICIQRWVSASTNVHLFVNQLTVNDTLKTNVGKTSNMFVVNANEKMQNIKIRKPNIS